MVLDRYGLGRRGRGRAGPPAGRALGIVLENGGDDSVVVERSTKDNATLTGKALASEGRRGGDLHLKPACFVDQLGGGFFCPLLP